MKIKNVVQLHKKCNALLKDFYIECTCLCFYKYQNFSIDFYNIPKNWKNIIKFNNIKEKDLYLNKNLLYTFIDNEYLIYKPNTLDRVILNKPTYQQVYDYMYFQFIQPLALIENRYRFVDNMNQNLKFGVKHV